MAKTSQHNSGVPEDAGRTLEAFALRYSSTLKSYFERRLGGRRHEAEDLVQEVFARLADMENLQGIDNPSAYLFRIASNLLRDRHRRAATQVQGTHEEIDDSLLDPSAFSPERDLLAREDLGRLLEAIRKLPKQPRIIFVMHRIEGMKYREIADTLGLSVSTVEKHMITAIARLASHKGGRS